MSDRRLPPAASRGMTLVELMVGVTIGLFLVAVTGAVYSGSKSTFVAQESSARIQENGRFAMDTIATDLRMSGFRGCIGGSAALTNTLNSAATLPYDFAQPIWGSRRMGLNWSPALQAPLLTLPVSGDGDVLVVRRPYGKAWSLVGQMADASAPLPISPTGQFQKGDLLVVADCAAATVLQATNGTPGVSGSIAHTAGAAGLAPGVATANLGRVYANDAVVWRMQTVMYYLAQSARHSGQMALWSYATPAYDGAAQANELVTGVERMGLTLGVDTDGDAAADRFVSPDAVANWTQVVNARIELVLVGGISDGSNVASSAQPYVFDGTTITPTDKRVRTVMSALVSLRNLVP